MTDVSSTWGQMANRSPAVLFIDECLRGAGQVIFQNNPLTGLFFLAAIWWGAAVAGQIEVAIGATIATMIATATAIILKTDQTSLREGLFGFNGILLGAAVPTFLGNNWEMWLLLILGSAIVTVVFLAISNVMKTWGLSAMTFPFVLTTWFLMLSAYLLQNINITTLTPPAFAHQGTFPELKAAALDYLEAWFKGPAQVFLINNALSGVLVVIGLLINSWYAAIFALVGSGLAIITALIFGADPHSIFNGLYGFSPVLTAVGLGCVFFRPSWRVTLYTLLGIVFTVFVQAALDAGLAPLGIPTFTGPFNFATWLFLLPKLNLRPQPNHSEITGGIVSDHHEHPAPQPRPTI